MTGNIYLLDVLATLCDLAGIDAPETNEGISMKPVLEGKQETVRDVLYGVYCGGAKPGMRCVKKGDWKLIKYDSPRDGVRETQLFNLADNPDEFLQEHHDPKVAELTGAKPSADQRDLAEDPRYARQARGDGSPAACRNAPPGRSLSPVEPTGRRAGIARDEKSAEEQADRSKMTSCS